MRQGALLNHILCAHHEDVVTVNNLTLFIHAEAAVSITVVSDTEVCIVFHNSLLQGFHMRGTAVVVDVHAVGQSMDNLDLGAQFTQNLGHHLISGTIGAIEHNLHAVKTFRAGADDEFDVLIEQIRAVFDMTDFLTRRTSQIVVIFELMHDFFEFIFHSIRQFVAVTAEELNPVVMERIVGCRNHDTSLSLMTASQISNCRRRNDTSQHSAATCRADTGCQGCFKHFTGQTRVTANENQRLFLAVTPKVNRSRTA